MASYRVKIGILLGTMVLLGVITGCIQSESPGPTALNCQKCHQDTHAKWAASVHAKTQADVAEELAGERAGQTPDEVINGDDAENCIACHAPTATLANSGMTETQALAYFFTNTDEKFTKDTASDHKSEWPSVTCLACHNVPDDHPDKPAKLAAFDSSTSQYATVLSTANLCGRCHGNLRFRDTDHLTYNAWTTNKHAKTQADVAEELAGERAGQTPDEVINGDDAENCIACHAPTATLANSGMTETQALAYFFTNTDEKFTKDTASNHKSEWPSVSCVACHDPHMPGQPSYFNSSTKKYETVNKSSNLCGRCHGNLRFQDTDHLSYNILSGTGGTGVPDQQTMPGVTCTDCHMYSSDKDDTNSKMYHGHSFAVIIKEPDGSRTASCTKCHSDMDASKAEQAIARYKKEFQQLYTQAQEEAGKAQKISQGDKVKGAMANLSYAESDESGGFHNHKYLMSLLQDAISRSKEVNPGESQ